MVTFVQLDLAQFLVCFDAHLNLAELLVCLDDVHLDLAQFLVHLDVTPHSLQICLPSIHFHQDLGR